MNSSCITVEIVVDKTPEVVFDFWTDEHHMTQWMHASDDWGCKNVHNNLTVGERFSCTLFAKDDSESFELSGTYTSVEYAKLLAYILDDGRTVSVSFISEGKKTRVTETFEMENENNEELQRSGWQAMLTNFKIYTESYDE